LRGAGREDFAREAATIIGDLNYVHPFREGNGRTQLQYLRLLTEEASLDLDLTKLRARRWLAASRAAHEVNYDPMRVSILAALTTEERG
jgi:cell filamentation protein